MKTNTETNTETQSDFNRYWLEPLENALQELSKCDARQAPISEQGYTHLALAELSQLRVGIQYLKDILDDPLDHEDFTSELKEESYAKKMMNGYEALEEMKEVSL